MSSNCCCNESITSRLIPTSLMHRIKGFSKILAAVDGSEASIRAAKHAFDIASRSSCRCTLYLLHIIPPQIILAHSSGYFGAVSPDLQKEIEEEAEEWFKRVLSNAKTSDHVHIIKKVISTGASIVTEIVSYSDRKEIELIVMGAIGKSGLRRLLLGSASAGVVTHSHCSVLVVR